MAAQRLRFLIMVAGIFFFAAVRTASALDNSRALTQYLHRIWQVPQGLPQATIYAVQQGEEGYLWLGTQRGLFRFDGVRFSILDLPGAEPLANDWIRDLLIAKNGDVWIATDDDGLFHIDPASGSVSRLARADGLPANRVNRLMQDKDGDIWACTSDGLALIKQNAIAHIYQMQQGLSGNDIAAVAQDEQGRIWVAAVGKMRLNLLAGDLFTQREIRSLSAGTIHDLLFANGKLWAATSAGLLTIEGDNERLYATTDGLTAGDVYRLMPTADGTLWVGMKEGFARLKASADHFETYTAADGLSQSTVYALALDREGSLWVGTKHGLNQFLDGRTVPYTTSEGLPSNETGPILQDKNGTIWIGTFDAGLCALNAKDAGSGDGIFSILTRDDGLAGDAVRALAEGAGSNHELWVGTDRGVNRIVNGKVTQTFGTASGLPSEDVRCLLLDRAGNLWAGTALGVAELKLGESKWSVPTFSQEVAANSPIVALFDTGDAIWAARETGPLLAITDGIAKEMSLDGDPSLPLRDVDAFYRDSAGLIWMGMHGEGLALYDGHKVQIFGVGEGLFDDDIRGIVADDQDRLWFACSKGIFSLQRADLNRLASGMIKTIVSSPYSPTEGLRTIESRAGVAPDVCRMADGRIWFSTIRGIISIDPAKLQRNLPPLPLAIEQVLVDGKEELAGVGGIERIGPGVKNIEFRYTGLSFASPTRLFFRYQLEGFDKNWIDAGLRREAYYTNLPPGKYRFRLQGSYDGAVWSEVKTPAQIFLEPFFYQRWWFWPACAALALLALAALYRMRLRDERRRISAIFAERGRIARELHDTLIQGFSGVTMEMQAFLGRLQNDKEKTSLSEIINDAGRCLKEARHSIAGLRQLDSAPTAFPDMLASVAKELTASKPVRLQLRVAGRLPPLAAEVEYNLLRIVREAIANALRHADPRTLEILLDATPGRIELEVKDDGRGFDPQHEMQGHYGLLGMHERAEEIGAKVDVASTPRQGTIVRVILEAAANK